MDRPKVEWGVLEDENELACSWHQGLHIDPDLSGFLAKRGAFSDLKTVITKLSEYSVYSSECSERARDN
jgi:hypothetical protein